MNVFICAFFLTVTYGSPIDPLTGSLITVATGKSPRTDKSQLIDVSSESTACANLPSYPFATDYAAGGVVNGSPIICGGRRSSRERTDSCHRFDRNSNSWELHSTMTSRRAGHASTVVKNALFITGGNDGSSRLATTEYIYANGTVQSGPNLPESRSAHCSVTLHDGKVMILGAVLSSLDRNVIIMDPADNSFTTGPSMSYEREQAACTLFNSPLHNGRPVVLAAGGIVQATSEVYDYTYANQWQTIGSLPTTHDYSFWGARALPSTTGNGAYLQNEEFLYELSCSSSSCNWSEMTQQLSTPVSGAVMMHLPDSFTCTN